MLTKLLNIKTLYHGNTCSFNPHKLSIQITPVLFEIYVLLAAACSYIYGYSYNQHYTFYDHITILLLYLYMYKMLYIWICTTKLSYHHIYCMQNLRHNYCNSLFYNTDTSGFNMAKCIQIHTVTSFLFQKQDFRGVCVQRYIMTKHLQANH